MCSDLTGPMSLSLDSWAPYAINGAFLVLGIAAWVAYRRDESLEEENPRDLSTKIKMVFRPAIAPNTIGWALSLAGLLVTKLMVATGCAEVRFVVLALFFGWFLLMVVSAVQICRSRYFRELLFGRS